MRNSELPLVGRVDIWELPILRTVARGIAADTQQTGQALRPERVSSDLPLCAWYTYAREMVSNLNKQFLWGKPRECLQASHVLALVSHGCLALAEYSYAEYCLTSSRSFPPPGFSQGYPRTEFLMSNLQVEINANFVKANDSIQLDSTVLMITPPLDEDYWLFRVKLYEDQAIVGFPKFGTIGIGFAQE